MKSSENMRTFALLSVTLLLMSSCALVIPMTVTDDSDAASHSYTITSEKKGNIHTINAKVGDTISIVGSLTSSYQILGLNNSVSVPGCTYSKTVYPNDSSNKAYELNGTLTKAGTYILDIVFMAAGMQSGTQGYITLNVSEAVTSYTVSFNSNGGSSSPSSQTVTSGSTITLPSPGSKSGYTFDGWYDGSSYAGGSGSSYKVSKNVTLTASWSLEVIYYTHNLYYDANGGSGAPSSQSSRITSSGTDFTVSSTVPSKSGHTFLGWSKSSTASSPSYYAGSSVHVNGNSSVTLYAVWQQNTYSHTLYYDANGGSGAPSTQSSTNTSNTHSFTIPSVIPKKDYHTFLGWSEDRNAISPSYYSGDRISVSANSSRTLYAVWQIVSIEIISTPGTTSVISGNSWSYPVVTNPNDGLVSVSVSGASWLTVNGTTVAGTPIQQGTYDIRVTAVYGSQTDSQDITLLVVDRLSFESIPTGGILISSAE